MNYTDRIFPTNKGLTTYLDDLKNKHYQIPTFQRDMVWSEENVKKLWDSIYKFYPLGSILIWKTNVKLQNHRDIGGHRISDDDFSRTEYQYILDGQQRTTSLLTSLYGGRIDKKPEFNPEIYVDLTIQSDDDTDDESYKNRFLFWNEIDDKNGEYRKNIGRRKRFDEGMIVKLIDIKRDFHKIQTRVFNSEDVMNDFKHPIMNELSKIQAVLENYRISFIEVKGIKVSEVCQIFERINQAGKPLDIFDIVVAKTFKPIDRNCNDQRIQHGFYLRDLIDDFRNTNKSEFLNISDLDYLQTIAVIINQNIENSGVKNITDRYLNEIKTEQILDIWDDAKKAVLKTFDFFENHLYIKTPALIPFRYFYFTITSYFYGNNHPNYNFLKQYFWYYCFHDEDLLSNTTHLFRHIDFLNKEKNNGVYQFERLLINRDKIRSSKYSTKGRVSRAVLSLYANARPKDWEYCDREVLSSNLFFVTDKPNLHHVFPTNSEYVLKSIDKNLISSDSLMNIVYLTQITNLNITNNNPLEYMAKYDNLKFENIMESHFLPEEILFWSRMNVMPENALDIFIEKRLDIILKTIREKLDGIQFEEIDTKAVKDIDEDEYLE